MSNITRPGFNSKVQNVLFSPVQFKMVSIHSETPIIMRFIPSLKFPQRCLWNSSNVHLIDDDPLSSFQGRSPSTSSFHASLLQVIDGVMSLALCQQVVSQAPQHFRSSDKQATCDGCFARQCIRSIIALRAGVSRAVHPQEFSKVDVDDCLLPVGSPPQRHAIR